MKKILSILMLAILTIAVLPLPAFGSVDNNVGNYQHLGVKVVVKPANAVTNTITDNDGNAGTRQSVRTPGTCSDSDLGKAWYVRGTIETDDYGTFVDRCIPETNTLREGYCGLDNGYMTQLRECENGCKDGACLAGSSDSFAAPIVSQQGEICDEDFTVDMNDDGEVNIEDAVLFTAPYQNNDLAADIDQDGIITVNDYECMNLYVSGALAFPPADCELACPKYSEPVCGDSVVEVGEECDDGNNVSGDGCSAECKEEVCVSALDYVDVAGDSLPDQAHSLGDAVVFTEYYFAEDPLADVNNDSLVDEQDYNCAQYYYSTAVYECRVNCGVCDEADFVNADFDNDESVTLDDAVIFTGYYENLSLEADVDGNGRVDLNDEYCMGWFLNDFNEELEVLDSAIGCSSPLDYVSADGTPVQDYVLSVVDSVMFTEYYDAKDLLADINDDGLVNINDLACAESYYANGIYECNLECVDVCSIFFFPNAELNGDEDVNIEDAVLFTEYFFDEDLRADINEDGLVNDHDTYCFGLFLNNEVDSLLPLA